MPSHARGAQSHSRLRAHCSEATAPSPPCPPVLPWVPGVCLPPPTPVSTHSPPSPESCTKLTGHIYNPETHPDLLGSWPFSGVFNPNPLSSRRPLNAASTHTRERTHMHTRTHGLNWASAALVLLTSILLSTLFPGVLLRAWKHQGGPVKPRPQGAQNATRFSAPWPPWSHAGQRRKDVLRPP